MQKKLLLFDLYNTLVFISSRQRAYSPIIEYLIKKGNDYTQLRHQLLTIPSDNIFTFLQTNFHLNVTSELINCTEQTDALLKQEIDSVQLFEETKDVLSQLQKDYCLVLISNLSSPYKQAVFNHQLDQYFDQLVFSCDIGFQKPQKEIFELAISKYSYSKNEILMIGDSLTDDKQGALNSGIDYQLIDRKHRIEDSIDNLTNLLT